MVVGYEMRIGNPKLAIMNTAETWNEQVKLILASQPPEPFYIMPTSHHKP